MHIFVGPVLISDQQYLEQILLLLRNTRGCIAAVSGKRQEVISEQKNIGANTISEQKYIKAKEDIIAKKIRAKNIGGKKYGNKQNIGSKKKYQSKKILEHCPRHQSIKNLVVFLEKIYNFLFSSQIIISCYHKNNIAIASSQYYAANELLQLYFTE